MSSFWDMHYSDQLRHELEEIQSNDQRWLFLKAFDRMGEYISENEDQEYITFREYFDQFEKDYSPRPKKNAKNKKRNTKAEDDEELYHHHF